MTVSLRTEAMPPMPKSEAPTAMTGHDVSYTQLDGVQCPVVYKVVGDGNSVEEYDAACRRRRAATAPTPQATAMSAEWHGLYTQTTVAHAAGTAGYRWDQGYREARVLELVLAPPPRLQRLRVMGAMMTDGAVVTSDQPTFPSKTDRVTVPSIAVFFLENP
jgi:hypothetical protein